MFGIAGHSVSLSLGRRFIADLLHAGMQIPLVTIQKDMNVADLVAARSRVPSRPSWCSIFTKAYAKMVANRPDMRRAYLTFPWTRMFEYDETSADITMEVRLGDENVLAFVPIQKPETIPLAEIDRLVADGAQDPLEKLTRLRDALFLARFPQFIRRFVWWTLLNVSGSLRGLYFSTFGVTSVGKWAVESIRPIAPAISILHYGTVDPDGKVAIRMTYDHRVLDGVGPSTALNEMEHFLHADLRTELTTATLAKPDSSEAA